MRAPFANALFFPAAALFAALIIPWWALGLTGVVEAPAGLQTSVHHAHEMIFGFAMAVVAGYLLGPQSMRFNVMAILAWLLARLTFLLWPGSWTASIAGSLFALCFALKVVPRFARSARKWRNRAIVPLVTALALLTGWAGFALKHFGQTALQTILIESILMLSCLMFFMGGRIIAPAIAGHLRHAGHQLESPVQPALEGVVLLCFALLLVMAPFLVLREVVGLLTVAIGALTATRLLRWRPWLCGDRPDLIVLIVGYAWLAAGLMLLGLAWTTQLITTHLSIHAITVGALGSLTLSVMVRTRTLYRYRDPNHFPLSRLAAGLISLAAVTRLIPELLPGSMSFDIAIQVAAIFWSAAFVILFFLLLKSTVVERRTHGWAID